MRGRAILATMAALMLAGGGAAAPVRDLANTQLPDPAEEARARVLMGELRCLVCQGQSIADSDSDLAGEMRALVRIRIHAGERPDQVRQWLIGRYGDYVSYDPPLSLATLPLWLTPLALLALGGWIAAQRMRLKRGRR